MTKKRFLHLLKQQLIKKGISISVREDILMDYESIIDEAVERGEDEYEYISRLSNIDQIVDRLENPTSLTHFTKIPESVVLMIIICTLMFIIIGGISNVWHPTWVVFLFIPILSIFKMYGQWHRGIKVLAVSPIVATIIFILLGSLGNLWHPGWLVYLVVPLIALLIEYK